MIFPIMVPSICQGCFLSAFHYKFDMEERAALYVCESLIRDCLLPKACAALPPDNRAIAAFSLKQSAALTDSLVVSEDYLPDHPRGRLSEDVPSTIPHKPVLRQYAPAPLRPNLQPKHSSFRRSSKASRTRQNREDAFGSGFMPPNPKLTPLQTCQDSSQEESQDLQSKLRERKVHQQYFRTRYQENLKQGAMRKKGFVGKLEGKGHNLVAYDFDGGVIPPNNKPEPLKLPLHFLDVEVSMGAPREEEKGIKKMASRVRIEGRREEEAKEGRGDGRKQELKVAQSHFFKDFGNIHWTEGVELMQSKQQCRQILGYQNPNARRKKVDLFKHSDHPVRIRLQDLTSYKNLLGSNSQHYLSQQNLRQSEKSMLLASSHSIHPDSKAKFITVSNSRALEFLIDNDPEPAPTPLMHNRSAFSKSKQLRFRS